MAKILISGGDGNLGQALGAGACAAKFRGQMVHKIVLLLESGRS